MIFKTQLKKSKTNIMTFDDNNNNNNKIQIDMEGNIYIIYSSTLLENENNNNIIIFTFNHSSRALHKYNYLIWIY